MLFRSRRIAVKFLVVLKPFKNKALRKEIIAVYRLFHSHRQFPRKLCLAALASLGIQFLYISVNFLVARGMNFQDIGFTTFFILVPLIAVTTMVPSIGGLGIREGMYVYFFKNIIGKDGAGALSLIMLVLVIAMALTGGIIYAISGSMRKARPESSGETEDGGQRTEDGGRKTEDGRRISNIQQGISNEQDLKNKRNLDRTIADRTIKKQKEI